MNLQEWRRLSFQLAADLQTLQIEARRVGLTTLADDAAALRTRVEDRRFTVAVVGDFRRGKSTFINALLGRAVLPSDVAPTTATVNRITYGSRPAAELRFHDERPPEPIPVEELAAHVTKLTESSTARAASIREAVVSWPVRFCRNDVDILDTPGLGDEATMTEVTLRRLPTADAAILVIMADSPFSATEGEFLDRLYAEGVRELLYVVSAIDRIRRPPDRDRVLRSIRDRIAARIRQIADARFPAGSPEHTAFLARHGEPRVFAVSALTALEAREAEDTTTHDALEASGMPQFERALEEFLTSADEVGLRRRVEQADALCRQFTPPTVPDAPSADLARLDRMVALVHALDSAVQDHRRRLGDACARAVVRLQEPSDRLAPRIQAKFGEDLRHPLGPRWPGKYAEYIVELSAMLAASVRRVVGLLAPEVERVLGEELAGLGEDEARLHRVARHVLPHVWRRLDALGPPPLGAGEVPPAPPAPFPLDAIAAELSPSEDEFMAAFADPALVDELLAASRRTAFDALLSLDFGGLQGRFITLATPRAMAVVEAHWARRGVNQALRDGMDRVAAARRAAIEPLLQGIRAVNGELVARRERLGLAREQQSRDFAASARTVGEIRERLRATGLG